MNDTEQIILGTMNFGTATPQAVAHDLIDAFVELGGRWLDTADVYAFWASEDGYGGQSETVIGRWLARRPGAGEAVRLSTKVRWMPYGEGEWPHAVAGLSPEAIDREFSGSLERLGVDRVDLLWAHAPDPDVPVEQSLAALSGEVAAGRAGALGLANHPAWLVERLRGLARSTGLPVPEVLQLRNSLAQPRPGAALPDIGHRLLTADDEEYAAAEGLPIWVYTPLLNGGYTRPDKPFPEAYRHPGTDAVLDALDAVCAETGATRNQVVLRWLLGRGQSPIVGVSSLEQLQEAMAAGGLELTVEQRRRLDEAR